jgi:hypothetical protein
LIVSDEKIIAATRCDLNETVIISRDVEWSEKSGSVSGS